MATDSPCANRSLASVSSRRERTKEKTGVGGFYLLDAQRTGRRGPNAAVSVSRVASEPGRKRQALGLQIVEREVSATATSCAAHSFALKTVQIRDL